MIFLRWLAVLVAVGVLGLAQVGTPLVLDKSATLTDIALAVFGDKTFAPAIMRATNSKALVDATFAHIPTLDVVLPAGAKVWIPEERWAKAFLAFWDPKRVEDLFGGGKLVVGSWWTTGGEVEGLNALFEIYRNIYPDVLIVNATVAGGAGFVFKAVLKPRLLAGDPPDTFQLHAGLEVESYSPEVYLQPLDELYKIYGWTEVFPSDLLELMLYEGHYWGVPVNIHRSNVLWYNKEIFAKYGFTPPETWDDFFVICKRLKQEGIIPLVLGNAGGWEVPHLFECILASTLGAEKYKGLWTGQTPWSDPGVTQALEILREILNYVNPDYAAHTWDTALDYFVIGKAAMHIMGDWAMGWFMAKGVDVGWAPVPGTKGIFVALSDTFALPKKAANPINALGWLLVCGSKEGQIAFNMRKGSIPARTDITPEEKAQFNPYLQSCMEDWARDAIVPSVMHGAAAIESWVVDFRDAINLFLITKDVAGTQKVLIQAAEAALARMR
ncbi:MAG: extracellular solute-binding protein [Nitrososphaerota archaeon]